MHSVYPRLIRPATIIHGRHGEVNLEKELINLSGQTNYEDKNLGGL